MRSPVDLHWREIKEIGYAVFKLDICDFILGWMEESPETLDTGGALLHWPEALGAEAWEEEFVAFKSKRGELQRDAEDVVQNFGNLVFRAELRHVAAFIGVGADALDFSPDCPERAHWIINLRTASARSLWLLNVQQLEAMRVVMRMEARR